MSNSLYEQLKAGASAEDIAAAFAEELNKAEEQVRVEREEEEKARAEEKAKAERVAAQRAKDAIKVDEAATLLHKLVAFISYYYPSLGLEDDEDLTEDDYRVLAELVLLMLDLEALKPAKRQFKLKASNEPVAKVEADKPIAKPALDDFFTETTPDPFADFFKAFGL